MNYKELFKEDNYIVMERFDLSAERIDIIQNENYVADTFKDYFKRTAGFIGQICELYRKLSRDELLSASIEELKAVNNNLYEDILPENYGKSYANPEYAVKMLGDGYGQILSFLYSEIRGEIIFAYESRLVDITILNELFIEIYNMFEEEVPEIEAIKSAIYWFHFDYCDNTVDYRVCEGLDLKHTFAVDIIMNSDLNDLRYLYRFGEYISEQELCTAKYLNSLQDEVINKMADTYTEGYRRGFEVMRRDLAKKKTVVIRYELGFERMVRRAIENFRVMGLEPIIYRAPVWSINKNPNRKAGYFGTPANKQYEYDHRYDKAVYFDKAIKERMLCVLRTAYEKYKQEAAEYAGPAVIETFGEENFEPVNKPEAVKLNEKQEQLMHAYANEAARIANEYIPGEETSFTIIAFPLPSIGDKFEEIFEDTIRINTLDYDKYTKIQQRIINVLDEAEYVVIKGRENNKTDLKVKLHAISDKEKETNFENCVADVNIPLGEVFTSPVLSGTDGLLHVGTVYIGDIKFKDLKIWFENGMAVQYTCSNFDNEDENKELVKQIILKNHNSLPMGEFAIGTNTTAYKMAQKYDILDKLPILIVEKMGPHFAVGDTCYSRAEDTPVYNFDGKEIIARDNEISIKRKTKIDEAYFNCHTDITIPYSELQSIYAVRSDNSIIPVIDNSIFAVEGTEELNKALTE